MTSSVESVAIGLLHAYANPRHEERVRKLILRECPDISITLSSEACPEVREYERLTTTVCNAYVRPLMARYLGALAAELAAAGIRWAVAADDIGRQHLLT